VCSNKSDRGEGGQPYLLTQKQSWGNSGIPLLYSDSIPWSGIEAATSALFNSGIEFKGNSGPNSLLNFDALT